MRNIFIYLLAIPLVLIIVIVAIMSEVNPDIPPRAVALIAAIVLSPVSVGLIFAHSRRVQKLNQSEQETSIVSVRPRSSFEELSSSTRALDDRKQLLTDVATVVRKLETKNLHERK